jgi:hypothetical protein
MIKVKPGVQFTCFRDEMIGVWDVIERLFMVIGVEMVITCGTDGHPDADPHPHGFAVDLRTHGVPSEKREPLRQSIADRLGPTYTVLLENPGTDEEKLKHAKEHIHVQYRKDLWRAIVAGEQHG